MAPGCVGNLGKGVGPGEETAGGASAEQGARPARGPPVRRLPGFFREALTLLPGLCGQSPGSSTSPRSCPWSAVPVPSCLPHSFAFKARLSWAGIPAPAGAALLPSLSRPALYWSPSSSREGVGVQRWQSQPGCLCPFRPPLALGPQEFNPATGLLLL